MSGEPDQPGTLDQPSDPDQPSDLAQPHASAPPGLPGVTRTPWEDLRAYTRARIALGRAGHSLPTREVLAFELAHAQARDAVYAPLDTASLAAEVARITAQRALPQVRSRAADRAEYLTRPDLGRLPDEGDLSALPAGAWDVAFVLADGLSARAVQAHAAPLLAALWPRLGGLSVAPPVVATQARVALADHIGARLGARLLVVLIGERPGLSTPESLGAYLTYQPRPGRLDAERNCVSNIHTAGGQGYAAAAHTLHALIRAALRLERSGVGLNLSGGVGGELPDGP